MNPEIKAKWIDALRSGEYTQTQDALRDSKGFCCLGVLCDIHSKQSKTKWEYNNKYMGSRVNIPHEVKKWAELELNHEYITNNLIEMNDYQNKSFNQIADYIEKIL